MAQLAFRRGAARRPATRSRCAPRRGRCLAGAPALSRSAARRFCRAAGARGRAARDRLALDLGFDQLGERRLITVMDGGGIERAVFGLDDVLGEIERLPRNLGRRNAGEDVGDRSALDSRS